MGDSKEPKLVFAVTKNRYKDSQPVTLGVRGDARPPVKSQLKVESLIAQLALAIDFVPDMLESFEPEAV